MKKIIAVASIAGFAALPILASSGICRADQNSIAMMFNNISPTYLTKLIDFTLSDEEGVFRDSCHKRKYIASIRDQIESGRMVSFNKKNLKLYIGLYMERKFNSLDYHEQIRADAIKIADRTFDDNLTLDAEQFYAGDDESLRARFKSFSMS